LCIKGEYFLIVSSTDFALRPLAKAAIIARIFTFHAGDAGMFSLSQHNAAARYPSPLAPSLTMR